MTTAEVLIVSLAAVVIVALVALAKWRIRTDELRAESSRAMAQADEREAHREHVADADEAARDAARARSMGPADGTTLGVYVGTQLVKGTRVMRDDPAADGWIVLDDAELLEGSKATPLGGQQWITATGQDRWFQAL